MRAFLFTVLTVLVSSAFAADRIPLSKTDTNVYEFFSGVIGKQVSLHVYLGDTGWTVEEHTIGDDGLPDLVKDSVRVFRSEQKAYEYAQSLGATEQNRFAQALDAAPSDEYADLMPITEGVVPTNQVAWVAEHEWNWDWEIKFAKWVRENLTPDLFQQIQIANDCADAYYQSRMIFARINKLPVSFRLAASGAWFTNNTMRPEWAKLPTNADWKKDKRFLRVLTYVADNTYTHTLGRDVYPIEISKEALIEGSVFLYLHDVSGHTLIVKEINLADADQDHKNRLPMYTLNSTVPKEVRPLEESFFFESTQPPHDGYGNDGFGRFRWPTSNGAKSLVDAKDMPYYSEEQYGPDFLNSNPALSGDDPAHKNFSLFVFKRLNPNFDPVLRITEGIDLIKTLLADRVEIVTKGYAACKNGCDPDSGLYDDWSTPSRDTRLQGLIADLDSYQNALFSIPTVPAAWKAALASPIVKIDGTDYTLGLVQWVWANNFFSTDPNQPPAIRWGVVPEGFAQGSYDALLPRLQARLAKISSVTCADCLLFTPEFFAASTFVEDGDLIDAVRLRQGYCQNSTPDLCQQMQNQLALLPAIVPSQSNFLDTWNNIETFNADPRVPQAVRWGDLSAVYPGALRIAGNWTASKNPTQQGMLLLSNMVTSSAQIVSGLSIVDTNAKKIIAQKSFPGAYTWTAEDSTSQILGLSSPSDVLVIDPTSGAELQHLQLPLAENESAYTANWVTPDIFIISTQTRYYVYARAADSKFALREALDNLGYTATFIGKRIITVSVNEFSAYDLELMKTEKVSLASMGIPANAASIYPSAYGRGYSVSWYATDANGGSLSGTIFVDLKAATAKVIPMALYNGSLPQPNGVLISSPAGTAQTAVIFFDDALNELSRVAVPGQCTTCYAATNIFQADQVIYTIDTAKRTVTPIAKISDGFTVSSTFDNLGIFMTYQAGGAANSALVDLNTGKVLAVAPSLSFQTGDTSDLSQFYPFVLADFGISESTDPNSEVPAKYYDFNSTLDPLNLAANSVSTVPGSQYEGGDDGGGCGDCDDEPEGLLPVKAAAPGLDFGSVQMSAPAVTTMGPGLPAQETARPVRLLNVGTSATYVIFNK